jgi:hypothetical protein
MKADGRKDSVGRNSAYCVNRKETLSVALISYCTLCTLDYYLIKGALCLPLYLCIALWINILGSGLT